MFPFFLILGGQDSIKTRDDLWTNMMTAVAGGVGLSHYKCCRTRDWPVTKERAALCFRGGANSVKKYDDSSGMRCWHVALPSVAVPEIGRWRKNGQRSVSGMEQIQSRYMMTAVARGVPCRTTKCCHSEIGRWRKKGQRSESGGEQIQSKNMMTAVAWGVGMSHYQVLPYQRLACDARKGSALNPGGSKFIQNIWWQRWHEVFPCRTIPSVAVSEIGRFCIRSGANNSKEQ